MKIGKSLFESTGFGDTVAKAIKRVAPNIKECGGCSKRRDTLNRLFPYKKCNNGVSSYE